jgi:serine/threonine protein kinase
LPAAIGRFVVTQRLGSGAFGTVYRATDPLLGREVALKVPQPGLLQNPKALERFLREARAAAGLRHPHIVTVFGTGIERGDHYIATEFIDGTTLAAAIGEAGLDPRRAAAIAAALAEALQFAHAQGIVHRDVKPANVMLDQAGQPHLMDFGLARIEGVAGERLTQVGAIVGTPAYLAPEQAAEGGGEANAGSDQYSLGVTLYELLTGKTPFSGPPEVVIYKLTHREIPPPRALRRAIPRDLETICLKAMAKAPAQRYTSCQELADDLRRWLRDEPIRARHPGGWGSSGATGSLRAWRRAWSSASSCSAAGSRRADQNRRSLPERCLTIPLRSVSFLSPAPSLRRLMASRRSPVRSRPGPSMESQVSSHPGLSRLPQVWSKSPRKPQRTRRISARRRPRKPPPGPIRS